tara:strand:+ start:292 stop:549 length:258 start_codon:yes stop_codon:yes gene_type:complete
MTDKIRAHRELLKQHLFNYDYSNVPVNKNILVELDYGHITVQSEGPSGFTHWKGSFSNEESLILRMNAEVVALPEYELIIVDRYE